MSQLQLDRTRFNLFYSADGCYEASQIHFCDAKISIYSELCKLLELFSMFVYLVENCFNENYMVNVPFTEADHCPLVIGRSQHH